MWRPAAVLLPAIDGPAGSLPQAGPASVSTRVQAFILNLLASAHEATPTSPSSAAARSSRASCRACRALPSSAGGPLDLGAGGRSADGAPLAVFGSLVGQVVALPLTWKGTDWSARYSLYRGRRSRRAAGRSPAWHPRPEGASSWRWGFSSPLAYSPAMLFVPRPQALRWGGIGRTAPSAGSAASSAASAGWRRHPQAVVHAARPGQGDTSAA